MTRIGYLSGLASLLVLTSQVHSAGFSWVVVGDPGNSPDFATGRGAVGYEYSIMTYEVTNAQYGEFLSAKAKSDPHGLFGSGLVNAGIRRTGSDGSYRYTVSSPLANRPVVYISLSDAQRFCNWVHNGMGNADTEQGAYDLTTGPTSLRDPEATVWLPNVNEWYKAAYYDPNRYSGAGGYYLYPTQSDSAPISRKPTDLPNSANYYNYDGNVNGQNDGYAAVGRYFYYVGETMVTPVGAYKGSPSHYGTFDQGGNAMEIIEFLGSANNNTMGGSWWYSGSELQSTSAIYYWPEERDTGFRMAAIPPPVIDAQPADVAVLEGQPAAFAVGVVGSGLKYQWRKNGTNITGATSNVYSLGSASKTAGGTYSVVITNLTGKVTSIGAKLTVVVAPGIKTQPLAKTVVQGKTATISAVATGTLNPATIQWKKDTVDLPGANATTLTIPNAQPSDAGLYSVDITNIAGSVSSNAVELTVVVPPTVISSPASLIVPLNQPFLQFVSSFGGSVGSLQWKRGAVVLRGATNGSLSISNVKLTDAGVYTVKSTNLAGNASTAAADLVVVDTSPKPIVQALNGQTTFTANAAGPILGYQWRKNGVPMTQIVGKVEGVQTKTLILKALVSEDAAIYTCMVTGTGGVLESGPFNLAVTDGVPQVIDPIGFVDGMVGDNYTFTPAVLAGDTIQPTKWAATGLPRGLKINAVTGEIFGVPTVAATFSVKVTASNPSGKGATVTAPLVIQKIPEGAVGAFVALLERSSLNGGFGGRLELTTSAGGAYSGKLILGGSTLRFSRGKLNIGIGRNDPNVVVINRSRPLSPLKLTWIVDHGNNLITGGQVEDMADPASNCLISAGWRRVWTTSLLADTYVGQYNFTLDNIGYVSGDTSQPAGVGFGSFKVASAKTGALTIAGRLADDTPFSMSTFVGPTGQVALYQSLYTNRGSVLGSLIVSPLGGAPAFLDSSLVGSFNWLKQAQPATVLAYAGGFGPLNLNANGLKYTPPPATANVLSTNVVTADLEFAADGLGTASLNPDALAFPLSLRNIATLSGHPAKTSLKIVSSTGLFSGTFTLLDYTPGKVVRTVAYKGVILRDSVGNGAGSGYFLLPQTGIPKPIPSYSGSVKLSATPP